MISTPKSDAPFIQIVGLLSDRTVRFDRGTVRVVSRKISSFPTGQNVDPDTAHPTSRVVECLIEVSAEFEHDGLLEDKPRNFTVPLSESEVGQFCTVYREFINFFNRAEHQHGPTVDFEVLLLPQIKINILDNRVSPKKRSVRLAFSLPYGIANLHSSNLSIMNEICAAMQARD